MANENKNNFESNDSEIDDETRIRRLVREEIRRSCPPTPTASQSLYANTQQMVRSAASSVLQEQQHNRSLSATPVNRPLKTVISTGGHGQPFRGGGGGKRKASPSHPYRLLGNKGRSSSSTCGSREKLKTVETVLLDENLDKGLEKYRLDEHMVVGSWFVDLIPNSSEMVIRMSLCSVYKSKLGLIKENDIEFVKVVRNIVSEPEIAPNLEWNSLRLKALIGQGKLYVRLKYMSALSLTYDVEEDDNDDALFNNVADIDDLESVPPPPCTSTAAALPTIQTSPVTVRSMSSSKC